MDKVSLWCRLILEGSTQYQGMIASSRDARAPAVAKGALTHSTCSTDPRTCHVQYLFVQTQFTTLFLNAPYLPVAKRSELVWVPGSHVLCHSKLGAFPVSCLANRSHGGVLNNLSSNVISIPDHSCTWTTGTNLITRQQMFASMCLSPHKIMHSHYHLHPHQEFGHLCLKLSRRVKLPSVSS